MSKDATENDRTCAEFARAALFPRRMHRDVASANHFPALLQLDLLRDKFLTNMAVSSVFPRHVVVVRNLSSDGAIEWNGVPDMNEREAKFEVIPDQLNVRCTSECHKILTDKKQRAFIAKSVDGKGSDIVLCSDRVLQSDYASAKYKGVAKELPPKSLQSVEETLAHQLVQVRHAIDGNTNNNAPIAEKAEIELEAARAAECYFSRHTYDEHKMVKKGTRLQTGYSWLPAGIQSWSMDKCLYAVSVENLVAQSIKKQEAAKAVQEAMKHQ